jgi:spermidine synthase
LVLRAVIFLLFFLSGAAGLVYEVTWARSLGLVFGASHLAVTTVLAVYMGGQALGSAIFGKLADRSAHPLRLYGMLELGIGVSAVAFLGLMRIYPWLYPPIARLGEGNGAYLTVVRTTFAVVAMIVPTTLMGGTLPVLTRFVSRRADIVAQQISFLYAFNTVGAVVGTLAAGFVLIRGLGVTATLLVAVAVSTAVGLAAVLLQRRARALEPAAVTEPAAPKGGSGELGDFPVRMTLLGIGVSGFCALGYEVLWTRMLTLVVGTSVYSFTVMLVAFLGGIGAAATRSRSCRWARGGRSASARSGSRRC